jgi:hypothetical protein
MLPREGRTPWSDRASGAQIAEVAVPPQVDGAERQALEGALDRLSRVTADLFTEVAHGIDKDLWLVEAHAQAKA